MRKIQIYHFWTGPERLPVDSFIGKFRKRFPSVGVQVQVLEWGLYFPTIWARIAERNPPNVSTTEIGQKLRELAKGGHLLDLTDLWQEEGYSKVFSPEMKKSCKMKGEFYGVPSKEYTFAVWYLTDVFREKGLRPPKTWDEFLKLCEAIKEEGMYPIIASDWETSLWFEHILTGLAGPDFYLRLMEGKESWTDPVVVEAYQWLKKLVDEYFYPDPYAYIFPMAWMKLNRREAAMQLQGEWVDGMWQRTYNYSPGGEYDYFILPPINPRVKRTMVMGGNAWVAFKGAPGHDKAMKFLKYAGSREAHELLAKAGMGILARKDLPSEIYNKILGRLRSDLSKCKTVPEIGVFLPTDFINFEGGQRLQILLSPKITKKEIVKLLTKVEKIFRKVAV